MTPLERLAACFKDQAYYSFVFDRDELDNYYVEVNRLPSCPYTTNLIIKEDVFPLIPKGGRWIQSLGWHSYFGIPLETHNAFWLAIGVEMVSEHATRGAFPKLYAYLFPFGKLDIKALQRLAELIDPVGTNVSNRLNDQDRGVIVSQSKSYREHSLIESWILRHAAECYRNGEDFLFRTLILSGDSVRGMPLFVSQSTVAGRILLSFCGRSDPRPRICYSRFLMATVPSIRKTFSEEVIDWLEENERSRID